MCWGLSKLQLYDTSVFDAAAGLVVLHIDTFNVIDVSNMMHAFARAYTHWANLAPEGLLFCFCCFVVLLFCYFCCFYVWVGGLGGDGGMWAGCGVCVGGWVGLLSW